MTKKIWGLKTTRKQSKIAKSSQEEPEYVMVCSMVLDDIDEDGKPILTSGLFGDLDEPEHQDKSNQTQEQKLPE